MRKPVFNVSSNLEFKNTNYTGEDIHEKMQRLMTTDEPIEDDANVKKVYTMRKDGVQPQFDVRTDKWDMALMAMDEINKTKIAKAEDYTKKTEIPEDESTEKG